MKPKLTGQALVDHWEKKLKKDGLSPVKPLTRSSTKARDGLVVVPNPRYADNQDHESADEQWADRACMELHGAPMSVHATDNASAWRALSQAIWHLPPRMFGAKRLAFLHAFAEHGDLARAARETKITRQIARTTLKAFLASRKENKC